MTADSPDTTAAARGGETTTQMLARMLDEALEALAALPNHVSTRSGYCAKCEGGCIQDMSNLGPSVPLAPHPWDAFAERERNVEAAQAFGRWMANVSEHRQ